MRQLSTFQIVVLGIFVALTLIGVGVFAASGGLRGGESVGEVVIWGTVDRDDMQGVLDTMRGSDKTFQNVTYAEKNPTTYATELINAMAAGRGPDLFLISQREVYSFSDKILIIPYSEVSRGTFVNSFIDEAQLFLTPEGALAMPFLVDPLVMYWNRDLFASAGVANPPLYWNDFLDLAPKISSLDGSSAVKRSAVALGVWSNVQNAKEILLNLLLQAGDPVTERDAEGELIVVLGDRRGGSTSDPSASALRFYTEFANPSKTTYSWNRSLPQSDDMFASGDLAVYFGFASEYGDFAARNPNLRYSIATIPQIEGARTRSTFGRLTGLAIPRSSANVAGALEVAKKLSSADAGPVVSNLTGLPPVRRDIAFDPSEDASISVFAQSALISGGFLDPSPTITNQIFQTMIESVISGKAEPASAIFDARRELEALVK